MTGTWRTTSAWRSFSRGAPKQPSRACRRRWTSIPRTGCCARAWGGLFLPRAAAHKRPPSSARPFAWIPGMQRPHPPSRPSSHLSPEMDEPQAPRFDPRRRSAVLIALLLVTSVAAFEGTVVSTAMPTIIRDLSGLSLYSWVFSIYLLTSTVTMPLYGRLADLHGRRRVLLVAIVLFLVGAGACASARSMPQLIAARALQGLGAGGPLPGALTGSGGTFSLRERPRVQGLFSAIWGTSALIGPIIGAGLTLAFGWRAIFSIILPLGIVTFTLVLTQMRETRSGPVESFDWAGGLTLAAGITALLFATLQR